MTEGIGSASVINPILVEVEGGAEGQNYKCRGQTARGHLLFLDFVRKVRTVPEMLGLMFSD